MGPNEQYKKVGDAIRASKPGNTIMIRAGVYTSDYAQITHALTLKGVGGVATLKAGASISNGKAILVTDADVTVENIAFAGAKVPDGNGAGIRQQTGNLTIRSSRFENNENGILTAADANAKIRIEDSTFVNNGKGDGQTHSIYVGRVGELTVLRTTITGTKVGHGVKSRAARTLVSGATIDDGVNGSTTSYAIDLPNGGVATIEKTTIRQGAATENPAMISFGAEGNLHATNSLAVNGNTFIESRPGPSTAVNNHTSVAVTGTGNTFTGFNADDKVLYGPGKIS